jgi:uridine phosphorylase
MMPKEISPEERAAAASRPSPIELQGASLGSSDLPRDQEVLIHPTREPGEEAVTPTVILTFTQPDYRALCRLIKAQEQPRHIWDCACRPGSWQGEALTVIAPAMGAPYAAMVLEKLIVLGARRVLVLGWCGSLSSQVRIGDLILPSLAVPGDGTSPHYWPDPGGIPPHPGLYDLLAARLRDAEIPWQAGSVWSTDAIYRETIGLVQSCQAQGILGIDLELAALFAVGRLRGIAVAGLMVVSDELFTFTWQKAEGSQPFRLAREKALHLVLDIAADAEGRDV